MLQVLKDMKFNQEFSQLKKELKDMKFNQELSQLKMECQLSSKLSNQKLPVVVTILWEQFQGILLELRKTNP
jgi:hypothetical protein